MVRVEMPVTRKTCSSADTAHCQAQDGHLIGAGPASQGLLAPPGGRTRLVLGFLGLLRCCRFGDGADVGVSAIGAGFGGGRPTNPNRSPQTGSSSPFEGGGGGGLGM